MKRYLVRFPDGTEVVRKANGPWFVVWRLSSRCFKAWDAKDNRWVLSGGWVHKSKARREAAKLRTATGWAEGSVADSRVKPGNRLMCGKGNVKVVKGEVIE